MEALEVIHVVGALLDLVIRLVGIEKVKAELSLREAQLTNLGADAAEIARWGRTSR